MADCLNQTSIRMFALATVFLVYVATIHVSKYQFNYNTFQLLSLTLHSVWCFLKITLLKECKGRTVTEAQYYLLLWQVVTLVRPHLAWVKFFFLILFLQMRSPGHSTLLVRRLGLTPVYAQVAGFASPWNYSNKPITFSFTSLRHSPPTWDYTSCLPPSFLVQFIPQCDLCVALWSAMSSPRHAHRWPGKSSWASPPCAVRRYSMFQSSQTLEWEVPLISGVKDG